MSIGKIVKFTSKVEKEKRKPCSACKRPLTEKTYEVFSKSGDSKYLICSFCHSFLQLSEEEKQTYLQKEKEKRQQVQQSKRCSVCKEVKTEGVRTIANKKLSPGVYKGIYICTACIDSTPLTAKERWALNQNALVTEKALEDMSEKVEADEGYNS